MIVLHLLAKHFTHQYIDIDECAEDIDGCAQICTNEVGSYFCTCLTGYQLATNEHACVDVDECADGTDRCSQTCTNAVGSYTCSCNVGYYLANDRQTCNGMS